MKNEVAGFVLVSGVIFLGFVLLNTTLKAQAEQLNKNVEKLPDGLVTAMGIRR